MQMLLPATPLPDAASWPVGGLLLVSGAWLARSFFRGFGRAETAVSPYRRQGCCDGCYRITRNPGYLGMALAYSRSSRS